LKENFHQFTIFRFHKEKEMVTFRKSLLLLAIVAMMAAAGSAQIGTPPPLSCTAQAGDAPLVRSEGLAELVGDVLLFCTGGTPTLMGQEIPKVNFRVFMNTTVTSRLYSSSNWNEALLLIDEPQDDNPITPVNEGDGQRLCPNSDGCTMYGIGKEPGLNYKFADYNVWQGQPVFDNVSGDGSTIDWLGVALDPPGTQATRVIRITNVRVNASEKGLGGLIPQQLTMYISIFGPTALPINNPVVQVGFVQRSLEFSVDDTADYLQCEDPSGYLDVTFTELFSSAFKKKNWQTTWNCPTCEEYQDIPGTNYNSESGLWNGALNNTHGAATAGRASQGTQLKAVFKNIPANVSIYVSRRNTNGASDNAATLVSGGAPLTWGSASGEEELSISSGVATAVWEIIGDNQSASDDVTFSVRVEYDAGDADLGDATVAGSYAPTSTVLAASSSAPVPRFVDTGEDDPLFSVISCATNLLWPYVTNQAGFDTGMVISNTTMDPFGTVGQTGACTINYYGNDDGDAPPASQTTSEIGPGGYAIWSLYNGGGVKNYGEAMDGMTIAATQGFEGYVIAECDFQMAHGYAFISDLGASRVAQGYLALILDSSMFDSSWHSRSASRTGSKSEKLDQ
jgi:hypothetical protein